MYKKFVLKPLLISRSLEEAIYASGEHQAPSRERIEGILESAKMGVSFSDLAIQHSEGGAALAGGDIGYVALEDLDADLQSLFDLEIDSYSGILESDRYFAVAYVYDVVEVEDEKVQIGVQMITINKLTLAEVLETYVEKQDVKIYLR